MADASDPTPGTASMQTIKVPLKPVYRTSPHPVDALFDRYLRLGSQQFAREGVSHLEHALQAAHLAETAAASNALFGAALRHDIGHLLQDERASAPQESHAVVGARFLRYSFGSELTEPIRLHVHAKRVLVTTEPDYLERFSPTARGRPERRVPELSVLDQQAFLDTPFASDAIELRRWDDQARDPAVKVPPLTHYRTLLDGLFTEYRVLVPGAVVQR